MTPNARCVSEAGASPHEPCETPYDDELRRLGDDFYRRDFGLLGYAPAVFTKISRDPFVVPR